MMFIPKVMIDNELTLLKEWLGLKWREAITWTMMTPFADAHMRHKPSMSKHGIFVN